MGGIAKGLLDAPDGSGSLVARLARLAHAAGAEVVLVGAHPAYAGLGLEVVPDREAGTGPLGGLVALLARAAGREVGAREVVVLSCDLPFLGRALLERLLHEAPGALALAPRREGRWEPLAARYDAERVLPVASRRLRERALSLQGLLDELDATALALDDETDAMLVDWDSPEDVGRAR